MGALAQISMSFSRPSNTKFTCFEGKLLSEFLCFSRNLISRSRKTWNSKDPGVLLNAFKFVSRAKKKRTFYLAIYALTISRRLVSDQGCHTSGPLVQSLPLLGGSRWWSAMQLGPSAVVFGWSGATHFEARGKSFLKCDTFEHTDK